MAELTPEQILAGVRVVKLSEAGIRLDERNANKHNPRGLQAISESMAEDGFGRPVLASGDLQMIAGEATIETAADRGIDEAIIIPTDGRRVIIHQRVDVQGGTPQAARMGVRDNRTAELDLAWDADALQALADDGVDLGGMWSEAEWQALTATPDAEDWQESIGALPDGEKAPFQQMTFTLSDEQAEAVKAALDAAKDAGPFVDTGNENSNGNALHRACEWYLTYANR